MSEAGSGGGRSVPSDRATGTGFLTVLLEDALIANGLDNRPVDGFPGLLTGSVEGTIGQWNFYARGDQESLGVVIYSVFPVNVPEMKRQAVAELATRANYLLKYGSLEMNFSDGEVRARTSARGGPEALDFNVISELVSSNLEVAELFFPAVREVAAEGAPPAQAVAGLLDRLRRS